MPAQLPNGVDTILGAHEDRLSRVESGVSACTVSLAEARLEITHIGETVCSGFESLGAKMDISHVQHAELRDHLSELKPRLEKLEGAQQDRAKRVKLFKSSLTSVLVAGCGAFAIKAAEWLWSVLK